MLEGRILNERYKVIKTIGGGGMANVYLGEDTILDREVAIKVLRLEYANDEEFITRFHREAQSATSLSHPNIVNIFDVGEEDNIYYMVMEYVEGMTLKQYIQLYAPLEVEETLDIMRQVSSAIAHAHANEIVHRDIKPQNILIDKYGQVKVTDFGIAVALSATALTQTNSVLGSVHYLSPEQARGGKANRKSDIYSLGIVMFELLTGRLPFSGQSPVSIALKHLQSDTPSIKEWNPLVQQSVENIVLKATTKDPFNRYDNVHEMEDALDSALDPNNDNVAVFTPPVVTGDVTKAIPIVKDESIQSEVGADDTVVHKGNDKQEEKHNPTKKKKRKKALIWVSSLLFILLGAILMALFVLPSIMQPKDVTIPDVSNKEYEEALQELIDLNLNVVRETTSDEEIEEGLVIETSPKAQEVVKEGREITVYVSLGPETVEFDDYVGRNFQQVERILNQRGFEDIRVYEKFSERPVGEIIDQTQPDPGDEVIPKNTNVIFEVSKGLEKVTLNNLEGTEMNAAIEYLQDKKLSADITEEYHEEIEEGYVISQSPGANEEVEINTVVDLTVSLGPPEKEPISHTVSFTVPYIESQEEGQEQEGQTVSIYVEDINHNISELYQPIETITEDTAYTLRLNIAPESEGTYKVVRDDQVVMEKSIAYEEIEGE
ncbi:Stk1 family PASTA domain-containing Ser/Thr kinase [Saliterribacillus persicus]|uniref:Serine/threonine-protein kinase PrkC n=1 Tax=Saliterribacillus persicus TaxID=930114 RepID=A0A368XS09_9BACI|nr:Stk1 family PASTA domain-containing Ser/Thr kinase [Saliterribacillus persicus]RCW70761.1 serine/threonine-protein kinase [Saliterribacillus persicus]